MERTSHESYECNHCGVYRSQHFLHLRLVERPRHRPRRSKHPFGLVQPPGLFLHDKGKLACPAHWVKTGLHYGRFLHFAVSLFLLCQSWRRLHWLGRCRLQDINKIKEAANSTEARIWPSLHRIKCKASGERCRVCNARGETWRSCSADLPL